MKNHVVKVDSNGYPLSYNMDEELSFGFYNRCWQSLDKTYASRRLERGMPDYAILDSLNI